MSDQWPPSLVLLEGNVDTLATKREKRRLETLRRHHFLEISQLTMSGLHERQVGAFRIGENLVFDQTQEIFAAVIQALSDNSLRFGQRDGAA